VYKPRKNYVQFHIVRKTAIVKAFQLYSNLKIIIKQISIWRKFETSARKSQPAYQHPYTDILNPQNIDRSNVELWLSVRKSTLRVFYCTTQITNFWFISQKTTVLCCRIQMIEKSIDKKHQLLIVCQQNRIDLRPAEVFIQNQRGQVYSTTLTGLNLQFIQYSNQLGYCSFRWTGILAIKCVRHANLPAFCNFCRNLIFERL